MQTPQSIPTPPSPPSLPSDRAPTRTELSDFIRQAIGTGLSSAQAAVEQELGTAISERNAIQASLDASTSSTQRAALTTQLNKANRKVRDLQRAVDKIKAGEDKVNGGGTYSETNPALQNPNDFVPTTMIVSVMSILFIGFPLAIAFSRIMLRRATNQAPQSSAQLTAEQTRRFDRLEQSVDAIAIEIERISESQRYLTKVLGEPRQNAPVGPGRADT